LDAIRRIPRLDAAAAWARERWPFVLFLLGLLAKGLALALTVDRELGLWFFPVSLSTAVALGAPALRLRGRLQVLLLFLLAGMVSVLVLADVVAFRGLDDVISAASLRYAGQVADIGDEVVSLLRLPDALLFADLPLLLAGAVLPAPWRDRFLRAAPRRQVAASVAIALAFTAVVVAADPARKDQFRGHARWIRSYGPLTYHVADLGRTAWAHLRRPAPSPEQLRDLGARIAASRSPGGDLAGAAQGRNLIVLQVESLQTFVLGLRLGGNPVVPHLDALAAESLVFDDFYEQTGVGRTADADFLVNCSQYPLRSGAVYYEYPENDYRCLPGVLAAHGYRTAAFQGIRPDFWNLRLVYPRLGFQRFDHLGTFVDDERIGLGLSDATFLRQTAAKLRELPEPFYAFVVTLSSHTPFNYPEIPRTLPLGDLTGTKEGAYLDALKYTDAAIGRFVAELAESRLLDRSLLVVYGDHYGCRTGRAETLVRFLDIPRDDHAAWFRVERRVPLLIRFPGGAHAGHRPGLAGQLDLAPTLLGLLGLPPGHAPFLGRDLLAPANPPPGLAFPYNSALGGDLFWQPRGAPFANGESRCIEFSTGRPLPFERCGPLADWARGELDASETLIRGNLASVLAREGERLGAALP
jgi:lipoteichoic acid synthase